VKVIRAWKLFRLRKDGSLGSLFINRRRRLPTDRWLAAGTHPTAGFAVRHGWHALAQRCAPHLSERGRVWKQVELSGKVQAIRRPVAHGSLWYLAARLRIIP
jgi:hypothetical protein